MKTAITVRTNISRFFTSFHDYSPDFQRTIQRNLIWATLSILLLVLSIEISLYRAVRKNVSHSRVEQLQQQIETPFTLLVEQLIEMSLKGIQGMGDTGEFDLTNISSLNKHMLFAMGKLPFQGTALQIANEDGTELLMFQSGPTLQTRLVRADGTAEWTRWEGTDVVGTPWTETIDYDPRMQKWYVTAQEQDISWIVPSSIPGINTFTASITASCSWKSSGKSYAVALHIPLQNIQTLLLLFSRNDEAAIFGPFESRDAVVMMSSGQQGSIQRIHVTEPSPDDEAAASDAQTAISAFMQQQWQHRIISVKELVGHVTVGSSQWWVGVEEMALGEQHFWLGIAVPEKSLSPAIQRQQRTMISALISTIVLAFIILGIQIRFFLKTSKELETEYIQRQEKNQGILQLIERGESNRLEFKSTIRWNLKNNKAGKEIEIAWLKTVAAYLNSEGGTILLGVRDDGKVLGLEADNFQNEDRLLLHVNNLLKQHIGLEFVQFIEVELHHLEEHQVLSIRCSRSKAPAFLLHNKDEQFYIRTGPSSLRLSGSEMLKYLEQQGNK